MLKIASSIIHNCWEIELQGLIMGEGTCFCFFLPIYFGCTMTEIKGGFFPIFMFIYIKLIFCYQSLL